MSKLALTARSPRAAAPRMSGSATPLPRRRSPRRGSGTITVPYERRCSAVRRSRCHYRTAKRALPSSPRRAYAGAAPWITSDRQRLAHGSNIATGRNSRSRLRRRSTATAILPCFRRACHHPNTGCSRITVRSVRLKRCTMISVSTVVVATRFGAATSIFRLRTTPMRDITVEPMS